VRLKAQAVRQAEREWKRAHELDPTYPATYPTRFATVGRFDEAIRTQELLLSKVLLDLNMNMDLASILLQAGQTNRSIEQTRKALEIDPNYWWAYQSLGLAYASKKQYPEAIAALEKARSVDSGAWLKTPLRPRIRLKKTSLLAVGTGKPGPHALAHLMCYRAARSNSLL